MQFNHYPLIVYLMFGYLVQNLSKCLMEVRNSMMIINLKRLKVLIKKFKQLGETQIYLNPFNRYLYNYRQGKIRFQLKYFLLQMEMF